MHPLARVNTRRILGWLNAIDRPIDGMGLSVDGSNHLPMGAIVGRHNRGNGPWRECFKDSMPEKIGGTKDWVG